MLQRIQTVYLLIVLILSSTCLYLSFNIDFTSPAGHYFQSNCGFLIFPILTLVTIFLYKRRHLQVMFSIILIFLFTIQGIIFGIEINIEDGFSFSELLICVSLACILLLYFARKNILKDEALVRSVDRIR